MPADQLPADHCSLLGAGSLSISEPAEERQAAGTSQQALLASTAKLSVLSAAPAADSHAASSMVPGAGDDLLAGPAPAAEQQQQQQQQQQQLSLALQWQCQPGEPCHVWVQELGCVQEAAEAVEGSSGQQDEGIVVVGSSRWLGVSFHGQWQSKVVLADAGCRKVRCLVVPAGRADDADGAAVLSCEVDVH